MIELLILYILLKRDFTMYAIHKRILERFGSYTTPSFGAIKPALTRLENNSDITTTKIMSDGGRLAVYYSITKNGEKTLRKLLQTEISKNPLQFFSEARVKLACSEVLTKEEKSELCNEITTKALLHKINAQKTLESDYIEKTETEKKLLQNTIAELDNLVKLSEIIA